MRFVNALIDLPFALPTIVAGLTLIALYGQRSPIGINIAYTRTAIVVALAFVTLPFVVRSVQPVLRELDREAEQAATSLGASNFVTFRRVVLPALVPAIASGCSLAFAKAVGEFGSIVLISGNIPLKTEVASVAIYGHLESSDIKRRDRARRAAARDLARHAPADRLSSSGWRGAMKANGSSATASRFLALGYLVALLIAPLALIFKDTFKDGVGAGLGSALATSTRCTPPS